MKTTLTQGECLSGATIGLMRQISAIKRNLPDCHGYEGVGWNIHIEGACGELAYAKIMGIHWPATINTFKEGGDVGLIQIKTRSEPWHELIIRDDDRDEDWFVLIVGQCPNYEIKGKILARDGKRDEWRKAHGGRPAAWFVPQAALLGVLT